MAKYNPPSYVPGTHSSPETAKVGTVGVQGIAPGPIHVAVNQQWAPTYVFVPTGTTKDGFPGVMLPVPTGSTVT